MKIRARLPLASLLALLLAAGASMAEGTHHIGAGVHYWVAVEDVDPDNIDEDGYAWVFSYQLRPADLSAIQLDLEVLPDDFAGATETVYAPQAYFLLGVSVYGGVGIGTYYSDGEFADDPFYVLRAGLNLELLPRIHLDVSGNYRFTEWGDDVTENIDTDTVTLAAIARIAL